jgi:glucokinase
MNGKFIIAIDLGGTNLKCSLLDGKLKVKDRTSFNTKSFDNKQKLIDGIVHSVNSFILKLNLDKKVILGIGLGLPGPVDTSSGVVHFLPNIKGWKEVGLKRILERETGLPVFIDNDAKLMALAEHESGSAKGFRNALCITLGTGVGGGLIIDNCLYRGNDNAAGEIGHMPLNEHGPACGCGSQACLEAYVGNSRIIDDARRLFGKKITLEQTSRMARSGNRKALRFWDGIAGKLGLALSGVVNLLNLDAVVIGGGVSYAGEVLFAGIKRTIRARAMSVQAKRVKILRAKLGNEAGMIGAGYLVKSRLSGKRCAGQQTNRKV